MSPVNVKLPDSQLRRLDAAIARGRAGNRSDALRQALERQLQEWDRQAWDDAWANVVPEAGKGDEFGGIGAAAVIGWADLDADV